MSGTLQTLAFYPPAAASGGPRRLNRQSLSPPATRFDSSVQFLAGIAPPQLAAKPLLVPRLLAAGSDQVNGSGDVEAIDSNADVSEVLLWARRVLDLVATNIIPFSLISGIILGLANPTPGCIAYKWSLPKFSTFGIFFISGLTLRSREIGAAVEAWPAGMFGLGSILLLTPLFSKLILQIQLDPQEFITGIAIFCCMPTTLSTGVALTQLVGGNSALALAMTVMSNLLCIITVLGIALDGMKKDQEARGKIEKAMDAIGSVWSMKKSSGLLWNYEESLERIWRHEGSRKQPMEIQFRCFWMIKTSIEGYIRSSLATDERIARLLSGRVLCESWVFFL